MRTHLERVEPARVSVTVDGAARVRVVGSALGFVRCGSERRWVFGRFDETFRVACGPKSIAICVRGLFGSRGHEVPVTHDADIRALASFAARAARGGSRWVRVGPAPTAPSLLAGGYPSPRAPRVSLESERATK